MSWIEKDFPVKRSPHIVKRRVPDGKHTCLVFESTVVSKELFSYIHIIASVTAPAHKLESRVKSETKKIGVSAMAEYEVAINHSDTDKTDR